ncbi:putative pyruvate decarboxylase [Methanocella arvoryzae MRE50]|uniref:Pyruvate decarboxylase n=1 Tax=Methanocella arvoryzae (strain DSM 22066 / NBRC 105507 / MRE50) TaxID=351160 RepID=Q0W4D3_METAR|nr:putative pyruvate decarboxylase [Methanocella arvoryzae MRE50]
MNTTADIVADKLIDWGVEVIFGIVGDGINPLLEALRVRQDRIRFVAVRHEEAGAFMASGYAKYTGKLGACLATTGPGAVHLLNGLYDAAMDGAPVIAITGTTYSDVIGTQYTQDVDTMALMKDVAAYSVRITGPRHALAVVDVACQAALSRQGVAHLTIPVDVQMRPLQEDKSSTAYGPIRGAPTWTPPAGTPPAEQLDAAAELLNSGSKTMILAGRGALGARSEVEQVADLLGAPIAKALLGKAVVSDDHPYTTGGIGHLGTRPSQELMQECDTLLILGSNMPYADYYPKPGQARCVQIDRDTTRISRRYPAKIGLTGDVRRTLAELLPRLQRREDRSFLQSARQRMEEWRKALAEAGENRGMPLKPQYVMTKLSGLLADDALVSVDCGAHTVYFARHVQMRDTQKLALSGNLATMGPALPYAIAGKLAYPGRQSVAIIGDGSFTMLMGELATAVKYDLPIKVVLFKNDSLQMVRFEQQGIGNPDFGVELQPIDFAKYAEACGADAFRCATPDEVEPALMAALESPRPALVEAIVDPDEPIAMPGKTIGPSPT